MRPHRLPPLLTAAAIAVATQPGPHPEPAPSESPAAEAPAAESPAAADAPPAAATDEERAVELFRQANQAYKEDRYEDAAALFEQAWQLAKTYDIAANYGHTAFQLGRHRKAAELFAFALARWPQTGTTASKQAAVDRLAEAKQHVGTIRVTVNTPGARITLDGDEVGFAPLDVDLFVDPGPHVVEGTMDGYQPAKLNLDAQAGSTENVALALEKLAGTVDGEAPKGDGPSLVPPIVVGAVGLVGVGIGIGMMVAAGGKASDADDQLSALQAQAGFPNVCRDPSPYAGGPECSSILETREDHDTFQTVGVVSLIIGGAALAASAVWLGVVLTSDDGGDTPTTTATATTRGTRISVAPWLSPDPSRRMGGVLVDGRF
ncbi:MAG: PEGA domain-containing protein [Deltaproteobacteria bacterium]|jgi:hypothetical protein|nr:PEGA domain-containing protein [Deltaproteobacteria bacterium]